MTRLTAASEVKNDIRNYSSNPAENLIHLHMNIAEFL
jgi:hypothetical protein